MDEVAYARHIRRAKEADFIYNTIRAIYGIEIPWQQAYFMAIKDKLLYPEEKELVKEFHPVK
ncbi:MAG: hypothetical protein IJB91_03660 [Oscillospiraceae bacterium]|nr:hypothetical protein [Oscillospiraceae bacterium]